jgi:nicotinamidase/pyrazinamidase
MLQVAESSPGLRLVFVDIDTQIDFLLPHGKLYLEDSKTILPNLHRLLEYALTQRILILQTADTHTEDDPEFSTYGYPAHCVAGTPGWNRVQESRLMPDLVISKDKNSPLLYGGSEKVILIEKPSFSIATNPRAISLLEALQPCHFIVFGVATEGCVRKSILSLREMNFTVSVVIDAVGHGQVKVGEQALEEFASLGVRPLTSDEICSGALLAESRSSRSAPRLTDVARM